MTDNPFAAVHQAVRTARQTLSAADSAAADMASLLRGRLRHVPLYLLVDLKRELRDFDAHRKVWKS